MKSKTTLKPKREARRDSSNKRRINSEVGDQCESAELVEILPYLLSCIAHFSSEHCVHVSSVLSFQGCRSIHGVDDAEHVLIAVFYSKKETS